MQSPATDLRDPAGQAAAVGWTVTYSVADAVVTVRSIASQLYPASSTQLAVMTSVPVVPVGQAAAVGSVVTYPVAAAVVTAKLPPLYPAASTQSAVMTSVPVETLAGQAAAVGSVVTYPVAAAVVAVKSPEPEVYPSRRRCTRRPPRSWR